MEEFIKSDIDFEDKQLHSLMNELCDCFEDKQFNFCKLCKTIYDIWHYCKDNFWRAKDNICYNSYKLLAKFGFDKKAVSRYKQCYERFVVRDTCILYFDFANFTPSKLFELLALSQDTALEYVKKGLITPTMTVKQIREFIKSLKDGTNKAEKVIEDTTINEDEIPMAYNPKQHYDFDYFQNKNKSQLLNMIWELQKEYEKLKKEKLKK